MDDLNFPTKPAAPDQYTQKRWEHSALRRRMLVGNWLEDLEDELARHIPSDRRASWGIADLSSNVFKNVCVSLSALYNDPPAVGVVGEAEGLLGRGGLVERAGLWPIMQRVQLFTIGMREMFLRVDISSSGKDLIYRPVTPDMIWAESPAGDPMNPNKLKELRLRSHPEINHGELFWAYDSFDISTDTPSFSVIGIDSSGSEAHDLTEIFFGSQMTGESYPYVDSSGSPRIPYSIFHASLGGANLFDPFDGAELVAGALTSSVLSTYLVHMARDCSHPQRYVMGAQLAGAGTYDMDGSSRRTAIASDPASILLFSPTEDMQGVGQPVMGQFSAGGDPMNLMEVITTYNRSLAQGAGISPASVQKISGDPRSGYAIAMSRSDQREAQRKFAPSMRFGDIATLELSAMIANRYLKTNYPESGYKIQYSAIPLSKEEAEGVRKDVMEKMQAGLITMIEAIRTIHPEFSEDEAAEYLREIKRQQIEFG